MDIVIIELLHDAFVLFYDTRSEPAVVVDDTGPYIPIDEGMEAIKLMKEGKLPGPDNISTEFLKHLDDNSFIPTWKKYIRPRANLTKAYKRQGVPVAEHEELIWKHAIASQTTCHTEEAAAFEGRELSP
ncbi:hypothetical protein Trydic_g332 [Trypoxylus dichotomus]